MFENIQERFDTYLNSLGSLKNSLLSATDDEHHNSHPEQDEEHNS